MLGGSWIRGGDWARVLLMGEGEVSGDGESPRSMSEEIEEGDM